MKEGDSSARTCKMMTGIDLKLYVRRIAMAPLPFTFRQLQIFASLCATRSFRRSAENLGISQASVSNLMNALEDQLGLALFVRGRGQRPVLTVEGRNFLDDLQKFQAAGEVLAAHRRPTAKDQTHPARFRILIGQGTLDRFIRPKLGRFLAMHQQIELAFESHTPSKRLSRNIADGRYDFVMVHRLAGRVAEPQLRQIALLEGGLYGHKKFAARRKLPLGLEQINKLPFVLPIAYPTENEMLEFYQSHGIQPRNVVGRSQHYDVIVSMVGRGIGIACFTAAILPTELHEDVIMLRPLENWRMMWYRKNTEGDPRRDAIQDFLMTSVLQDPDYRTIPSSGGNTE